MKTSRYPNNPEMNQRYLRAKKKTEMLQKFYKHLIIYVVVNIIISSIKIYNYTNNRGYTYEEAFGILDVYVVWVIWGVFVILQAIKTFKSNVILGADWEEKKIREYMDENRY